jgi:hypothetical protein
MSSPLAFTFELSEDQLETLAGQVARILEKSHDDGFFDTDGAAMFLKTTPKGVYHMVEKGKLKAHRGTGRLLFTRADLRAAAE